MHWRVVLPLWFCFLLAYVSRQSIFSIFPVLRTELSFTEVELGLTGALFLWVYALGNPIAGAIADRFSKRKLVVFSLFLWSACTFFMGTAGSSQGFLAWRSLLAVAQSLYFPVAAALITQIHSEYRRSTALSFHGTAQYAGVILGGWYGGLLTESLNWQWMLWIVALVGIAYAPLAYGILREPESGKTEAPLLSTAEKISVRQVLRTPTYVALCLSFFAVCAMLWMLYTWLPDLLQSKFNLSLADAGFIATAYVQVATIVGLACGALTADRWVKHTKRGRAYILLLGLAVASPFLYLIVNTDSLSVAKSAAVGYGFFKGLFTANLFASVCDIIPKERQGFAIGFCNMSGGIAGGLGSYFVGALKGVVAVETVFGTAALLGIFAALVLALALWRWFLRDYSEAHPEYSVAGAY